MHSQLLFDGGEPRPSGARIFRMGVALRAGVGLLIGAIAALSLSAPMFSETSALKSTSVVALRTSHRAGKLHDRYAVKGPHDAFYGMGAKQVQQSKKIVKQHVLFKMKQRALQQYLLLLQNVILLEMALIE